MVSDLISRQAAIDALDKRFDSIPMEQTTEILLLRKDLRNLPSAQPEPQWIPVSERLPEERGFYLTTTKDKAVYCDYWNEDNFDRTEMVIAWMPLPEPYKTESEDKQCKI